MDESHAAHVRAEHEVNRTLQQHVRLHQQEAVRHQVEQCLDGNHVAHTAPVVVGAVPRHVVRVFLQFRVDVHKLSTGVVDDAHAFHLLGEWACLHFHAFYAITFGVVNILRVVDHCHFIVLPAVLSEAKNGSLSQFGSVEIDDDYLSVFSHWFSGVIFHLLKGRVWDRQRWSRPGSPARGR